MGKPPLIDMDAAAERLGTSPRHLRRLVTDRKIEHVKVGRFLRFDPTVLDAYVERQTVAAIDR